MSLKEVVCEYMATCEWLLREKDSDGSSLESRSLLLRVVLDGGMHLGRHVQWKFKSHTRLKSSAGFLQGFSSVQFAILFGQRSVLEEGLGPWVNAIQEAADRSRGTNPDLLRRIRGTTAFCRKLWISWAGKLGGNGEGNQKRFCTNWKWDDGEIFAKLGNIFKTLIWK